MEAKSDTVTIRFSAEELEKIMEYMKQHKIKSMNDFVRQSTGFLISYVEAMTNVVKSKEIVEAVEKFNHDIRTELDKVPFKEANLRGMCQVFEKEVLPKYEAEIKKGAVHAKPFAKKRKAGRPKNPKRKRGERNKLGYGK